MLLVLLVLYCVHAEEFRGLLQQPGPFKSIAKYSFQETDENVGRNGISISLKFKSTAQTPDQIYFLVYSGVDSTTFQTFQTYHYCHSKVAAASLIVPLELKKAKYISDLEQGEKYLEEFILMSSDVTGYSWIAFANCNASCENPRQPCQGPLDFEYSVECTNAGGIRISAHEMKHMSLFLTMMVLQIVVWLYAIRVKRALAKSRKLHYTVHLLIRSIHLELFALIMYCWYYGTLQGAGIRKNGLRIIGDIAFGLSEMFLILMMILVAKGWTIVRRKISSQGRVKIAVFSTFYVAIYTMSLIWKAERGNMMTVDSEYELPSGRLLFLLQCYLVLWFSYASWTTWRAYKRKRGFYKKYTVLAGMFLLSPIVSYLSSGHVVAVNRSFFRDAMRVISLMFAHIVLISMYNPYGFFRKTFPFHASTLDMSGKASFVLSDRKPPKLTPGPSWNRKRGGAIAPSEELIVEEDKSEITGVSGMYFQPTSTHEFRTATEALEGFRRRLNGTQIWSDAVHHYMTKAGPQDRRKLLKSENLDNDLVATGNTALDQALDSILNHPDK